MKRNLKIAGFWVLGTMSALFASMIAGNLEKEIGVTDTGYMIALVMAFILFAFAGLLWISVAIAVKKSAED